MKYDVPGQGETFQNNSILFFSSNIKREITLRNAQQVTLGQAMSVQI